MKTTKQQIESEAKKKMKKTNNLLVKVTYQVGIADLDLSEEDYKALLSAYENGDELEYSSAFLDETKARAFMWLSDNIKEEEALTWKYEIEEFFKYYGKRH